MEFCALDLHLEIFFEQVVVQLIGGRQLRPIDFRQARQCVRGVFLALADRVEAAVRPAIVPTAVAERRSHRWILFQGVVPFRFEECVQRFAGILVFGIGREDERRRHHEDKIFQ